MGSLARHIGVRCISPRSLMRWAATIAFAGVVVAGVASPARGGSEDNNALCSQDFEASEFLLRCDAAAWNLVAPGRSYAWKFWYGPNDSSSRQYKILGGSAVSWPYESVGRYFYQLTVSNGTPSGTQVYGPYSVEIANEPPSAGDEPGAETPPDPPPTAADEVTAEFDVSPSSVRIHEDATFTARQAPDANTWFQWQFSDGFTSYSPSFSRKFAAAGVVNVKLTVYTKEGTQWTLSDATDWRPYAVKASQLEPLMVVEGDVGENLGVGVANGAAWVLGRGKLATVNVADPDAEDFGEILAVSEQFRSRATALAVSDRLVAVGAGTLGVFLFNGADPASLTPIANEVFYYQSSVSTFRISVLSLHLDGDLLFVGLSHGLRVLNVADPEAPRLVGSANGFTAWSLLTHAGQVLVGCQRPMGFYLFPVPDASSAEPVSLVADGFVPTRYRPQQFAHEGDIVVVTENTYTSGDVSFFDAANNYKQVGRIGGGGAWYRGATIVNDMAFSALGDDLTGIRFGSGMSPRVESVAPLGSAHFGFYLASDDRNLVYAGTSNATLVILELKE